MSTPITLTSQKDIKQTQVITDLKDMTEVTPYGASMYFKDGEPKSVAVHIIESRVPLRNLLINNQSRLTEILDSDAGTSEKLALIVREAIEADDYE